jgi:23S rRNA U2552 (ribose-2'-O)-methylase RlmE/FtsJ
MTIAFSKTHSKTSSKKLFSTRLDVSDIETIKKVSKIRGVSTQQLISQLIKQTLSNHSNLPIQDPWQKFFGSVDIPENFESVIQDKRKQSLQVKIKRLTKYDE